MKFNFPVASKSVLPEALDRHSQAIHEINRGKSRNGSANIKVRQRVDWKVWGRDGA